MGLSAQDVIGKTAREIYPEDHAEDAEAEDISVARTGKASSQEWGLEFADGVKHLIASTKFPVSDANGVTIGVAIFAIVL